MMFFEPVDRNTENSQTDLWYKQTDGGKTISERDRHTADRRTNRQTNRQKDNNGRMDKQTRNKLTDKHKTPRQTGTCTNKRTTEQLFVTERQKHGRQPNTPTNGQTHTEQ